LPLFADDVSLQTKNIRYELASVHIFIPELDVEQASVRPASVAGQGQILSLASLVSAADVKRIVIPELFIRQDSPAFEKAASYQDIELTDIAGGRIGAGRAFGCPLYRVGQQSCSRKCRCAACPSGGRAV